MSRLGILAGDSPEAGVVLAIRSGRWVVRWARLLGVSVGLCGSLLSAGCEPTSDMVMRKDLEVYKANQKTVENEQNRQITELSNRLKFLETESKSRDDTIEGNLETERNERMSAVRRVDELIAQNEQTIAGIEEDLSKETGKYSELKTQQQRLDERFVGLEGDVKTQVNEVDTRLAEFSNQFSNDVDGLHDAYNSLVITLRQHYQNLSIQLKRGQGDVKMQIEDFGKQIEEFADLAQSMAERSRVLVEEASDIMDTIVKQTSEFTTELEARTKEQEAEQEAPTEQP